MIGILLGELALTRSKKVPLKKNNYALVTPESKLTYVGLMTLALGKTMLKSASSDPNLENKIIENYHTLKKCVGYNIEEDSQVFTHTALCGLIGKDANEVKRFAHRVIKMTSRNQEVCEAAIALAVTVHKASYYKIRTLKYVEEHLFPLDFNLSMIAKRKLGIIKPLHALAYAIESHLEGTSFTDSIHISMSIKHLDSQILPMSGAITSKAYGLPKELKDKLVNHLDPVLRDIVISFNEKFPTRLLNKRYRVPYRVYGQLPIMYQPYVIGKDYLNKMKESIIDIKRVKLLFDENPDIKYNLAPQIREVFSEKDFKRYLKVIMQANTFLNFFISGLGKANSMRNHQNSFHNEDSYDRLEHTALLLKKKDYLNLDSTEVQFSIFHRLKVMSWGSGILESFNKDIDSLYLVDLYHYFLHYFNDQKLYEVYGYRQYSHEIDVMYKYKTTLRY